MKDGNTQKTADNEEDEPPKKPSKAGRRDNAGNQDDDDRNRSMKRLEGKGNMSQCDRCGLVSIHDFRRHRRGSGCELRRRSRLGTSKSGIERNCYPTSQVSRAFSRYD